MERTRPIKLEFSSARPRPCWRSTGCFAFTLCCLWQVSILLLTTHFFFFINVILFRFQLPFSRIPGTLIFNKIFGSRITLLFFFSRICSPHTSRIRRASRSMMLPLLPSLVIVWVFSSEYWTLPYLSLSGCRRVCRIKQLYRQLMNHIVVVSLKDGWVNTWAVDWPWCASSSLTIFLCFIHIEYFYSSFVLLIGGTYFRAISCSHIYIFKSFHPSMDFTFLFRRSFRRCFLHSVQCARSVGSCMLAPSSLLFHQN